MKYIAGKAPVTKCGAAKRKPLKAVELFAGAGGMALGLEQAGFKVQELVEFNADAVATLHHNRPHWNVVHQDVTTLNFKHLEGKIDLVTGGFPCQAFSHTGKYLGFADTRGTLFREVIRTIQDIKPKAFMCENVVGLLTHDEGRTFATVMHEFKQLGYRVVWRRLKAVEYGIPQTRERVIIVGTRTKFKWPKPVEQRRTLKDALEGCPPSAGFRYSVFKRNLMEQVPAGGNWKHLPEDMAKKYMRTLYNLGSSVGVARRLTWDKPSPTIVGNPGQRITEMCHPEHTRPLNIRECARIQTFPDDWHFCGSVSSQHKQIGNAVPVDLAYHLGKALRRHIRREDEAENP